MPNRRSFLATLSALITVPVVAMGLGRKQETTTLHSPWLNNDDPLSVWEIKYGTEAGRLFRPVRQIAPNHWEIEYLA